MAADESPPADPAALYREVMRLPRALYAAEPKAVGRVKAELVRPGWYRPLTGRPASDKEDR